MFILLIVLLLLLFGGGWWGTGRYGYGAWSPLGLLVLVLLVLWVTGNLPA